MYTLTFNDQMLMLLNQALLELPKKHADPFIQAINIQIKEQVTAKEKVNSDNVQQTEE